MNIVFRGQMMSEKNWKVLTTLSGKGGVGKTTVASSLAYSFSQMGFKTLIVDLDVGLRNIDLQFQIQSEIVFDLEHVLKGVVSVDQALIQPSYLENLSVLTSSLSRHIESIPKESFHRFLEAAKEHFEMIIIDAPAGVHPYMLDLVSVSDKFVLVSQPHQASMRSIDKLLGLLESKNPKDIHWVINRFKEGIHSRETIRRFEELMNFKARFILSDFEEITIASSQSLTIGRHHTPKLINKSIQLAQILLSKDPEQLDPKQSCPEKLSWWQTWVQWAKNYT